MIPLHLPPGDASTERTLQIDGTSEQIESAKLLVNEVISEVCLIHVSCRLCAIMPSTICSIVCNLFNYTHLIKQMNFYVWMILLFFVDSLWKIRIMFVMLIIAHVYICPLSFSSPSVSIWIVLFIGCLEFFYGRKILLLVACQK